MKFIKYNLKEEGDSRIGLIYGSYGEVVEDSLYLLVRDYDQDTQKLTETFTVVSGDLYNVEFLDLQAPDDLDLSFTPEDITAKDLQAVFSGTVAWWDNDKGDDATMALARELRSKLLKAFLCFNNPAALASYMSQALPNNEDFNMMPYAQRRNIIKV